MIATAELLAWLERLRGRRVLVVGDVMLDRFVYGSVDRISPEGPIPVLRVRREAAMLGGAGNVVRNIVALGGEAVFISVIGRDPAGTELTKLLAGERGVDPILIAERGRDTTIKSRFVAGPQQLLRADVESDAPLGAATRHDLLARAGAALADCEILVISDYGKGVLADGVAEQLIAAARAAGRKVVVDPKGRNFSRYRGADLITPNLRELADATGRAPGDSDEAVAAAAQALRAECGVAAVLATRGRDGMMLADAGGITKIRGEAREVFDVAGAGDTVLAMIACAVAGGASLAIAAGLGNVAGGIVVGKAGTAVATVDELAAALQSGITRQHGKVCTLDELMRLVAQWRASGLRVGFTNGCFDLLHPGHVSLLRQARTRCDRLVVGLNSDQSVRRLKGAQRPAQSQAARAAVLASLADVDAVTIFDADTPADLIAALRPELLVKGADYDEAAVVGAALVRSYGGEVFLAELVEGFSTSGTLSRIGAPPPAKT